MTAFQFTGRPLVLASSSRKSMPSPCRAWPMVHSIEPRLNSRITFAISRNSSRGATWVGK